MIEHQQSKYNWHFTFLGANQDAFTEAGSMGMTGGGSANYAASKPAAAYAVTSGKVARMRRQSREGQTVDNAFTDTERQNMS
jgi:hypothetical protein